MHPGHRVTAHGTDGEEAMGCGVNEPWGGEDILLFQILRSPCFGCLLEQSTEGRWSAFLFVYFQHFLPISVKMFTIKLRNENAWGSIEPYFRKINGLDTPM